MNGPFNTFGKLFIGLGLFMIILGVLFILKDKITWLGHLPGDIDIKREGVRIYIPITTCLLISLILSLLFRLFR